MQHPKKVLAKLSTQWAFTMHRVTVVREAAWLVGSWTSGCVFFFSSWLDYYNRQFPLGPRRTFCRWSNTAISMRFISWWCSDWKSKRDWTILMLSGGHQIAWALTPPNCYLAVHVSIISVLQFFFRRYKLPRPVPKGALRKIRVKITFSPNE